jgi:pyruvate ferredoxin oxidoreductase alpha subunit
MSKRIGIETSLAIAETVKLVNVDVVAAYPITPQTHIVEHIADLCANGELDAEYIPVESEHSAMSACLGSSAGGARTFTATASQGLELMHEVLYVASGMRLPIVMAVANRAVSAPLSIWGDHSDVMSCRDTGWIQVFVENGQEAVDMTICSFIIAEDPSVLLPFMINLDGFHLSHVIEPIILPDQDEVKAFVPDFNYKYRLDPHNPVAMGDFATPAIFTEAKWANEVALTNSRAVINDVWDRFYKTFGRKYQAVETYKTEDAETLLMTMGSFSETAMTAIDAMREQGRKVGLVRIRLWRPFPFDDIYEAVKECKNLIILDRALSAGGPAGPVASEVKAALYNKSVKPAIVSIVGGLGGRDIHVSDFINMVDIGEKAIKNNDIKPFEIYGVRG